MVTTLCNKVGQLSDSLPFSSKCSMYNFYIILSQFFTIIIKGHHTMYSGFPFVTAGQFSSKCSMYDFYIILSKYFTIIYRVTILCI